MLVSNWLSPPHRLPSEILIYILSYLDVSSLFCIMHVSKLFYQLASDKYDMSHAVSFRTVYQDFQMILLTIK